MPSLLPLETPHHAAGVARRQSRSAAPDPNLWQPRPCLASCRQRERGHAPPHGARPLGLVLAAAAPASNVHAIGVGHKLVDAAPTGDMAVRFYVSRKMPKSMLGDVSMLPATIAGLPVDVIQTQPAALAATPPYQSRVRPVQGGTSDAHFSVTAGTIACICRSTDPGDSPNALLVLSNNHVLGPADW